MAKRGGGIPALSLEFENAEGRFQLEPATDETPERVFDRRWAITLLDRVLSRLRAEMVRDGKALQFEHLKTYLVGDLPQVSYAMSAAALSMSEGAVKVAVHRLRGRYRDLVRDEIMQTVSSPAEVEGRTSAFVVERFDMTDVEVNGHRSLDSCEKKGHNRWGVFHEDYRRFHCRCRRVERIAVRTGAKARAERLRARVDSRMYQGLYLHCRPPHRG
jgi:hypothetical protein